MSRGMHRSTVEANRPTVVQIADKLHQARHAVDTLVRTERCAAPPEHIDYALAEAIVEDRALA